MRNWILLSTAVIMPAMAYALPSDFPTYTHTDTPIELRSVSHISEIKLASVCFLGSGDCGSLSFDKGDSDYKVDTVQKCKNEGFTITSCTLPAYPSGACTYNEKYFAKCVEDKPRACKEAGYTDTCTSGFKLKASPRCPWNNSYGICCKENCPANSSLTCTGTNAGDDTCGYTCKQCCTTACPIGTSESNPGGCGGSTPNGCKTKTCYYPYQTCCDNSGNASCPADNFSWEYTNSCGNIRYNCYKYQCFETITATTPCSSKLSGKDTFYGFSNYHTSRICYTKDNRQVYSGVGHSYSCYSAYSFKNNEAGCNQYTKNICRVGTSAGDFMTNNVKE